MQEPEETQADQPNESVDRSTQMAVNDDQPAAVDIAAEVEVADGANDGVKAPDIANGSAEEPDADAAPKLSAEAISTNADQVIEQSEPGFLHRAISQNGLAVTEISIDAKPGLIGLQNTLDKGELLTVNSDGSFFYDPNGAYDDLPSGETVVASALVLTVVDTTNQLGATMLVSISVNGVNESIHSNPAQILRTAVIQGQEKLLNLLEMSGATRLDAEDVTLVKINGTAFAGSIPFMLPSGARVTVSGDGRFCFEPLTCPLGECLVSFTVSVDGEETTLELSIEVEAE